MKLIYAIQHNVTKRIYIGCTGKAGRVQSHLLSLKGHRHKNELMQKDCDDFGHNFSAYILEVVPDGIGSESEQKWMHYFDTGNPEHGYNYKDHKAKKKSINEFPAYTYDGWLGKLHSDHRAERKAFRKQVMERMFELGYDFTDVAIRSRMDADRVKRCLTDERCFTEKDAVKIAESLYIDLY